MSYKSDLREANRRQWEKLADEIATHQFEEDVSALKMETSDEALTFEAIQLRHLLSQRFNKRHSNTEIEMARGKLVAQRHALQGNATPTEGPSDGD